jgi:hypothetical protein
LFKSRRRAAGERRRFTGAQTFGIVTAAVLTTGAVVGGGFALAAPPSTPSTFYACQNTGTKVIAGSITVNTPPTCGKNQALVQWNETGPAGATGASGTNGSDGATGPTGATGAPGLTNTTRYTWSGTTTNDFFTLHLVSSNMTLPVGARVTVVSYNFTVDLSACTASNISFGNWTPNSLGSDVTWQTPNAAVTNATSLPLQGGSTGSFDAAGTFGVAISSRCVGAEPPPLTFTITFDVTTPPTTFN